MPKITFEELSESIVSIFAYGEVGSGKTYLPTTLYGPKYPDAIAMITGDKRGLKTLKSRGYAAVGDHWFHFKPAPEKDPFGEVGMAVDRATRDDRIKILAIDGATDLYIQYVHFHTDGAGDKAMGYDGWGHLKTKFEHLEMQLDEARSRGKNVIVTALEEPPEFVTEGYGKNASQVLVKKGGPWVAGKGGKVWLPSKFDMIARAQIKVDRKPGAPGKPAVETMTGILNVKPSRDPAFPSLASGPWIQRTRLSYLPNPCPSSLKFILDQIRSANG